MTESFVVVPASYVYLLREGADGPEVLLQQRGPVPYMPGHWAAAAAGHVERGETAYDAARREALEELGLTHVDLEFELTMQRTAGGAPIDERVDFFFTAHSWDGEPAVTEPEKCAQIRWCRLDALPEPMVPHEAHALSLLGSGVRYVSFGFSGVPTPETDTGGAP